MTSRAVTGRSSRERCLAAAMSGGLGRAEARQVIDVLFKEKERLAKAEGDTARWAAAMSEAWKKHMEEAKILAARQSRDAAISLLRRQELDARKDAMKAEGFTALDFIEAVMVGSEKRGFGARDSVDARRAAIAKDYKGGLINELEALHDTPAGPVLTLLRDDPAFNKNVIREMLSPESTGDAAARAVADVLSRHLEKARSRGLEAGADIGHVSGYIPQSHDP